jgi:hypothetical protein
MTAILASVMRHHTAMLVRPAPPRDLVLERLQHCPFVFAPAPFIVRILYSGFMQVYMALLVWLRRHSAGLPMPPLKQQVIDQGPPLAVLRPLVQ